MACPVSRLLCLQPRLIWPVLDTRFRGYDTGGKSCFLVIPGVEKLLPPPLAARNPGDVIKTGKQDHILTVTGTT